MSWANTCVASLPLPLLAFRCLPLLLCLSPASLCPHSLLAFLVHRSSEFYAPHDIFAAGALHFFLLLPTLAKVKGKRGNKSCKHTHTHTRSKHNKRTHRCKFYVHISHLQRHTHAHTAYTASWKRVKICYFKCWPKGSKGEGRRNRERGVVAPSWLGLG